MFILLLLLIVFCVLIAMNWPSTGVGGGSEVGDAIEGSKKLQTMQSQIMQDLHAYVKK